MSNCTNSPHCMARLYAPTYYTNYVNNLLYLYLQCSFMNRKYSTLYYCFAILAGCTLTDLGVVGRSPDERCVGLQNSAEFTGGVLCYSSVTPGSLAVYICNSTHHLEGLSLKMNSHTSLPQKAPSLPHCRMKWEQDYSEQAGGEQELTHELGARPVDALKIKESLPYGSVYIGQALIIIT